MKTNQPKEDFLSFKDFSMDETGKPSRPLTPYERRVFNAALRWKDADNLERLRVFGAMHNPEDAGRLSDFLEAASKIAYKLLLMDTLIWGGRDHDEANTDGSKEDK